MTSCADEAGKERFYEVQVRAYYNWIDRGCPYGSPMVDWLKAEQDMALKHFLENPKTHNY